MLKFKTCILGFTSVAALMVVGEALAHPSVLRKNTPHAFAVRQEASGTTAHNDFSSSHGCAHQDGTEDIRAAAMVFPNGEHVVVEDGDGNFVDEEELFAALEPGENVTMGPLTGPNVYWRRVEQLSGPARPFVLRGDNKTEDVRAFRFEAGRVPGDMLYNLPWRATFGKIVDPCVKKIEMRFGIAHYCGQGLGSPVTADVYVGRLTPIFDDASWVSEGFWPTLDIINEDFDGESCGEGIVYKVSPSDEDVDTYLPIPGYLGTPRPEGRSDVVVFPLGFL